MVHSGLVLVRSVNPERLGQPRRRFDVSFVSFFNRWLDGRLLVAHAVVLLRVLQQVAARGLAHCRHHAHLLLMIAVSVLVGRAHDVRPHHLDLAVVAHDVDLGAV